MTGISYGPPPRTIRTISEANQRALVNFTILADSTQSNLGGFSHYIKVNAIHNILTKSIAKNEGAANDSIYGTDPVSIYNNNMWIGDGYLNIYFETLWGGKTPTLST